MDTDTYLQALTLWFAVLIFLRTGSGSSGPIVTAIALFAGLLSLMIPLGLLIGAIEDLTED